MAKAKKLTTKQKILSLLRRQKIAVSIVSVALFSVLGTYILAKSFAAVQPMRTQSQYQMPASADGHRLLQTDATLETLSGDAPYFWAMQSYFLNSTGVYPNGTLYMGLQNRGSRVSDGSLGKTAVFSIFGATVYGSPGACVIHQNNFDGYGSVGGTSCRVAYNWVTGRKYTFKASYTGTSNLGRYWSGYIVDTVTGISTKIADVNIPSSWTNGLGGTPITWLEFMGIFPQDCKDIPLAQVRFTTLVSDHGAAIGQPPNFNYTPSATQCTNANYTNGPGYVVQQNGTATTTAPPPTTPVTPAADTTSPTPPSIVSLTANAYNNIKVIWGGATDNVGVKKYYVVRNGVTIAAVENAINYVDNAVSASTGYNYSIIAEDAAGNKSNNSAAKSVTTPPMPAATTPSIPSTPVVTSLSAPSNPLVSAINYNDANIWWYTQAKWTPPANQSGIIGYKIEVLKNGSVVQTQNVGATARSADIKDLAPGGYLLRIYSFGNNGLQSVPVTKTLTTSCQQLFWFFSTCTAN